MEYGKSIPVVVDEFYRFEGVQGGEMLWNVVPCPMWSVGYPLCCASDVWGKVVGGLVGDGDEGVVFGDGIG